MWKQVIIGFLLCLTLEVTGFAAYGRKTARLCDTTIQAEKDDGLDLEVYHRRQFLRVATFSAIGMAGAASWFPQEAQARYILDDETGDYVEVEDEDWQTEWRQRLDKAKGMSQKEIFEAARGAGNLNLKDGSESDASKKRRAMSACRNTTIRAKANAGNERECTARVFAGEVDFLLDAL